MSNVITQAYDEMKLYEVVCRLPGDYAMAALKRRVSSPAGFEKFFSTPDVDGAGKITAVKDYINEVVAGVSVASLLNDVDAKLYPKLFGWLSADNKSRILADGGNILSPEFVFNLSDKSNVDEMVFALRRVLEEPEPGVSKVTSVLNRADASCLNTLVGVVLKDARPLVVSSILSIYSKADKITDHQKMIALKAFAKIPESQAGSRHVEPVDFRLFQDLKPLERIMALGRYLGYFSAGGRAAPFNPAPSEEDFDKILFAGAFQYNDLVEDIKKKYQAITAVHSDA